MVKHTNEISLTEKLVNKMGKFYADNKVPLLTSFCVGFLTYTFAFTNKLVNWDDISYLFSKGATIDSGRWALPLMSWIFPDYSMPWIYGVISIVIMAVAICVLIQELQIENNALQALFSGLVIAFPTMIGTVAYMFTLTSYAVAFLLAVAAIHYAKGTWQNRLFAIGLSVFSMGIYQPYIAVTSSFFLLIMIHSLIVDNEEAKKVFQKGLYYLFHLAITCLLYLVINRIVQQVSGISYNDYAQERISFSGIVSLRRIKRTYTIFITELLYGEFSFMSSPLARIMHVGVFGASGICIFVWMKKVRNWKQIMMLICIILLLPMSISCMVLVVDDVGVHTMLFYSFIAVYGLVCILLNDKIRIINSTRLHNLLFDIVSVSLAIVLVCNVYVGNRAYLQTYISDLNAYAFFTSLITRIEAQSDFSADTKVALIGKADQFIYDMSEFEGASSPQVKGTTGFEVNRWSREEFIKYYVGCDFNYANSKEIADIVCNSEFSTMPIYPYEGSIRRFGDIMVVKFSDPTLEAERDQLVEE